MNTSSEIYHELRKVNRPGMKKLIEYLLHSDFFRAPASANHHLKIQGGLAQHSLNVYKTLKILVDSFNIPLREDSIRICGLLHDICKIGIYKEVEDGYVRMDSFPIGHGDKSIIILQNYISLTEEEIILIRWHMGPYDMSLRENQKDLSTRYPYYRLLYFADDISTTLEG